MRAVKSKFAFNGRVQGGDIVGKVTGKVTCKVSGKVMGKVKRRIKAWNCNEAGCNAKKEENIGKLH